MLRQNQHFDHWKGTLTITIEMGRERIEMGRERIEMGRERIEIGMGERSRSVGERSRSNYTDRSGVCLVAGGRFGFSLMGGMRGVEALREAASTGSSIPVVNVASNARKSTARDSSGVPMRFIGVISLPSFSNGASRQPR